MLSGGAAAGLGMMIVGFRDYTHLLFTDTIDPFFAG